VKSDWMRRASLAVGAALLVLALVIFAVGPRTTFRAAASFTVSRPIVAGDVIAEVRLADLHARPAGAQGIEADATANDRATARRRVVEAVQRALDECVVAASTTATRRTAASRALANRAEAEAAAVLAASGVKDPLHAYQQNLADLDRLERARDAAKARGKPVADLDIRIASTQQNVFDLDFLVKRLAALRKQQERAALDSAGAMQTADGARTAAESMKRDLRVTESRSGGWQGTALVLAALGVAIAGIPALARRRTLPRLARAHAPRVGARHQASAPPVPMSAEDAILVEETLARARARRAGAYAEPAVDNGHSSAEAEPHIDLIVEERVEMRPLDAERPLGSN
jgi:hypothetical protein